MYSITMLSPSIPLSIPLFPRLSRLPSSHRLSVSLSLSLLPSPSFALKTVRILLSCCLDLTPDLFPQNRIRLFFSRSPIPPIISSALSPDTEATWIFLDDSRSMRDDCPLINHARRVTGYCGIINDFILP